MESLQSTTQGTTQTAAVQKVLVNDQKAPQNQKRTRQNVISCNQKTLRWLHVSRRKTSCDQILNLLNWHNDRVNTKNTHFSSCCLSQVLAAMLTIRLFLLVYSTHSKRKEIGTHVC